MNRNSSGGQCLSQTLFRQGQTGTCWFYNILNGLMATLPGRYLVMTAMKRYIQTYVVSDVARRDFLTPTTTCPMYKKLYSRFNFWKMIYHAYESRPTNVVNSRNVSNLVRNVLSIRRSGSVSLGYSEDNIVPVLDRLGITNYDIIANNNVLRNVPRPDFKLLLLPLISSVHHKIQDGGEFYVSVASIYISFSNLETRHIVAGIKCNNNWYIIDSNFPELIPCDWTNIGNVSTNQILAQKYAGYGQILNPSYGYVMYFRKVPGLKELPKSEITELLKIDRKRESFTQEIESVSRMWEGYKMAFFNENDPTAVLRANFLISYLLFKFEFSGLLNKYPFVFDNLAQVQNVLGDIIVAQASPNANKQIGFNHKEDGIYKGVMMLKKSAMNKLMVNGTLVSVTSQQYKDAENEMVAKCEAINVPINESNWKGTFAQTFMGQNSKFIDSAHYTSLGMFGWWGMFGMRYSTSQGRWVATERPGTCNVVGSLNMYLWKKKGMLDRLIYVAHGKKAVSRASEINAITATRAAGSDDVQFCHHGWQLNKQKPLTESGMYIGPWWQKVLYSHSDAFDVLTLAPIFRCIQRLRRQGRPERVQYPRLLVSKLNTKIKDFLENHLMSSIPDSGPIIQMKSNTVLSKNPMYNKYAKSNKLVGRGGKGEVYKMNNNKVIKFVKTSNKNYRFNREYTIAKRAGNLQIGPKVYNKGRNQNHLWYTMNHIKNAEPLTTFAKKHNTTTKKKMSNMLTFGVNKLHNAGIAHLDLHPDNILISSKNSKHHRMYIINYGAAEVPKGGNKVTANNVNQFLTRISGGVKWNRDPRYYVVANKKLLSNRAQLNLIKNWLK